jgi:peptide/nickel transport system permease protein
VFVLVRLSGIDPVVTITGGKKATAATIAAVSHKYYLDRSYPEQYFIWISNILKGDLGISYKYLQPVNTLIKGRLTVTFGLITISITLMLFFAVISGVISAIKKNTWEDRCISIAGLFLLSTPAFLLGILIILLLTEFAPGISFSGAFDNFGEYFERLFFPAAALSACLYSVVSRLIRRNMIEQLQSEYITAARAKGLSPIRIIFRHAFKNALIPVLTVVGIQIGGLMSGTVLVENVFALPGIGSMLVDGINASDYPVVQSLTLLFVVVFLAINVTVDILYAVIDPRIRVS